MMGGFKAAVVVAAWSLPSTPSVNISRLLGLPVLWGREIGR
jgi:hypothetical protein